MARIAIMVTLILMALALPIGALQAGSAYALDLADQRVEIHGYGDTTFLVPSKNKLRGVDSSGGWKSQVALLFGAQVVEDSTIWAQIYGDGDGIRLDWAFVDHKLNNNLYLRGGQIKTPIGIYNEIRDIKYLQLSAIPPFIYQEGTDFFHEAFQGAGLNYNHDVGSGNLALDLYGGQTVAFEDDEEPVNQLLGARLTYKTPVDGLRLIASGRTGKVKNDEEKGRSSLLVGSVEYLNHGFDLRAEYARLRELDETSYGYYAQLGYSVSDALTPYLRYEYLRGEEHEEVAPSSYQRGLVLGADYKFNDHVSFRAEHHFLKGFAVPVMRDDVDADQAEQNWNLSAASLNFMF